MEYLIHSSTGELYHHGVKGQKWGIRRYQNADGSLKNARRKNYSDDAKRIAELKKKKPYELSNKELQEVQNRTNLEKSFNDSKKSKAKKLLDKTLDKIGEQATSKIATAVVAAGTAFAIGYLAKTGKIDFKKVGEKVGGLVSDNVKKVFPKAPNSTFSSKSRMKKPSKKKITVNPKTVMWKTGGPY